MFRRYHSEVPSMLQQNLNKHITILDIGDETIHLDFLRSSSPKFGKGTFENAMYQLRLLPLKQYLCTADTWISTEMMANS